MAVSLLLFGQCVAGDVKKRNILLLCIDDLRPVMGSYGGAAITPRMDAFAAGAVQFDRHYVQYPVCGPSRASMLGGLRPDSSGIYQIGDSWKISKHPESRPTMPYYFKAQGTSRQHKSRCLIFLPLRLRTGRCDKRAGPALGWPVFYALRCTSG